LRGFWRGYFAARAAPLGRVGAGPVTAAFYNFDSNMVARAVPECWEVVEPEVLCRVRAIAAAEALSDICSTDARSSAIAVLALLRRASDSAEVSGRMLAAANRSLWPTIATALGTGGLGEVWQACTTLREHRGDGHVAALVAAGIGGTEAHLLAVATKGIPPDLLRDNRGWDAATWDEAKARLVARGLVQRDGRATDSGRTLHAEVEERTDRLAEQPFAALSDAALDDLYGALLACAADVVASGLVPFPNPIGLPSARPSA
jgi:hypothetical protein